MSEQKQTEQAPEATAEKQARPPAQARQTLAELAAAIERELVEAVGNDRRRIERYRNAGGFYKLAKKRAKLEGTTFGKWFESQKRPYSMRTVEWWMALDKYWGGVAPMLREANPGSEINYKKLVTEERRRIKALACGEQAVQPARRQQHRWEPALTKTLKTKLTTLRTKHENLTTANALFNFLKEIGLNRSQWKKLEEA
jgi:hypothetical protein